MRVRRAVKPTAPESEELAVPAGVDAIQKTPLQKHIAPWRGLLPSHRSRTVVILTAEVDPDCLALVAHEFVGDFVVVISAKPASAPQSGNFRILEAATIAHVEDELMRLGPVDVLIQHRPLLLGDLVGSVRHLVFHLRRGGVYLIDRRGVSRDESWTDLVDLFGRIERRRSDGVNEGLDEDEEVLESIDTFGISRRLVVLTKATTHHLKLRDARTDELLTARKGVRAPQIVARRDGGSHRSGALVRQYGATRKPFGFEPLITCPPVTLRKYVGKIALVGRSLLYTDHVILPGSFRRLYTGLPHEWLIDAGQHFARVPAKHRPDKVLPGAYFHADSARAGHFGHIMTEVVSRLWGWPEAKASCPDLKAIYRQASEEPDAQLERQVLEAFGIVPEDIVGVDSPVYLETVYSATPMWHNHHPSYYAHPEMVRVWDEFRRNLGTDRVAGASQRLFVSRRPTSRYRQCFNASQVEQFFATRGFTVVYPERHSLVEQATMFAEAEVVAGFAGSGMLNALFCRDLRRMIVLGQEAYTARNEYLIASLLGFELHYLWSSPDVPPDGLTQNAFHAPWTFDFGKHKAHLDRLLG